MLVAPDEPLEYSVGPYTSRTVIQSSFGTGEGEFGTAMWLGEGDYPAGLAVDDNGNIFILDHLNNRIQEFDASGEYLRSIDVISFQNGADSTWNGWTGPWPTIHGTSLYLYEDYLYVPIWRGFNKCTAEPKAIYKYDLDGNMHEVSLTEYEEMFLHVCPETLTFNNELLITLNEQGVTIDSGSVVTTIGLRRQGDYIKLDKYGNLWVILYTIPGIAQIFDLHGKELGQLHQRTCFPCDMGLTSPYIDSNGNIWQILISQYKLRVVAWEITTTESSQVGAGADIFDGSVLVLHKELSGYRNYGELDRASDILYSGESATWTFINDSFPDFIPAHFTVQGVLDDHYTIPESDYTITITVNEQEVFNGSVEQHFKHGRSH